MAVIGRPREFDRDAALEAAMLLFWRKGFAMTSMSDLCEAMGIRSPSLYAAFGNKRRMFELALRRYCAGLVADAVVLAKPDLALEHDPHPVGRIAGAIEVDACRDGSDLHPLK